jgi:hypothetical protein
MYTALYFPHTEVRSKSLVKAALLTWDKLETIIPFPEYRPRYEGVVARAMEIVGAARPPTVAEKKRVHTLVEDLVKRGVPETFSYRPNGFEPDYEMWPGKLAHETWQLLADNGLVGGALPGSDYPASQAAGLTFMSIIADVMAGDTRARITDRSLAYATIANAPNVALESHSNAADFEQVVPLSFKTIDIDAVPIERLIAFREREEKSAKSRDYRALRHNYLDRLAAHLKTIAGYSVGSPDRIELDRIFAQKMEDDLADLKYELGVAKKDVIFSKEILALVGMVGGLSALVGSGPFSAVPLAIAGAVKSAGFAITVGGPVALSYKYGAARKKILRQHPMAYLYEAQRSR